MNPYRCSKCNCTEHYRKLRTDGRIHRACKNCAKVARRGWRLRNNDKINVYNKARNGELRDTVLQKYGSVCNACGESNSVVIDLDHKAGGGRREQAIGPYAHYVRALALQHPNDEFQLLCRNCNWLKFRTGAVPDRWGTLSEVLAPC